MGEPRNRSRRQMLLRLQDAARTVAALGLWGATTGCGKSQPEQDPLRLEVPLDELPQGRRVRRMHREIPLELRRTPQGVEARSLQCTHMGCEVRWIPEREIYECPCHRGLFDADGAVMAGEPKRALDRFPVRIEGGSAIVLLDG